MKNKTIHKIGDKVKIRKDLHVGDRIDGIPIQEEMCEFCGKTVTISHVFIDEDGESYYIDEDINGFYWSSSMFQ